MKRDTSTRSTLSIDAVAQAAAQGGLPAAPALGKITAIAGLAGFVLRLFRRSGHGGEAKAPRRESEGRAEPERSAHEGRAAGAGAERGGVHRTRRRRAEPWVRRRSMPPSAP